MTHRKWVNNVLNHGGQKERKKGRKEKRRKMKERKKNLYRPNELVIVVCFYCIKTFIYQYVIYDIG